ncbi:MAG TPA: ATP-binding cassette domain-containing protein [Gemmataceae bacterium]|nr:ATP-binding cassette domain-containing protein [Gemmataceae bacterium]
MSAVNIEQVTKTFRQHVAVENLGLQVPRGSIYGFIGPNGSGKTTTLRMIMRILYPDRGVIRVLDEPEASEQSNRSILDRVAYLPEERGLYKQMKVREILRFYAELKGFRRSGPEIDAWLKRMDLSAWADKKVETLSKGMAQKVQFIATVIARPELVLLDEPFSGLDPVNTETLRDVILDLRRNGATIVFSTHDMGVAEKLCDFICMIYKGRKVLDGTLESIQDAYGNDTLRVHLEGPAILDDLPGVVKVTDLGRWQELRLDPKADAQEILVTLIQRGRVRHFEISRPTLHDIFVRIARPDVAPEDKLHA